MMFQYKVILFIVLSAGMVWLSRYSLRSLRSHGFYRYFAWESILLLILLNTENWFLEPFKPTQIISWLLLIVSAWLAGHGLVLLRQFGKPSNERIDPTLIGLEKTTELVTVGLYRYIRHPIYGALLFGAWGLFFKQPSILTGALTLVASFFLVMTSKIEETENIRYFGVAYEDYMKRTRMFVPFLF